MRPEISGYAPDGKMTGGMGLGSLPPQQRYSNNPFTYTSTAGAQQPVPSFLDLLDQERVKTVEAIVKPVEADKGPSLADTRPPADAYGTGQGATEGNRTDPLSATEIGAINGFGAGFGRGMVTGNPFGAVMQGVRGAFNGGKAAAAEQAAKDDATQAAKEARAMDAKAASEAEAQQNAADFGAQQNAQNNGPSNNSEIGDTGGGNSDSNTGGDSGRGSQSSQGGRNGGDSGGFAKGGKVGLSDVRQFTAGGPNAPGIDDGLVDTGVGDFILTAERTAHFGDDMLKALAEGRAEIVMTGERA